MCSAWISGFGLNSSFRNGRKQRAQPADRAAVRLVERVFAERVVRRRRLGRADPAVLLEQPRAHALGIDELLELDVGQLADLFLGVVHAALLADARADLPHDLLDVDVVGANGKIRHESSLSGIPCDRRRAPARALRVRNSGAWVMQVPEDAERADEGLAARQLELRAVLADLREAVRVGRQRSPSCGTAGPTGCRARRASCASR